VRYRQRAYDYTKIFSGTNAGHEAEHDWSVPEPYTADWDEGGYPGTLLFIDQPGYDPGMGIAEDSELVYIFGACWEVWIEGTDERMSLGPFYGKVTGAHPRTYSPTAEGGVWTKSNRDGLVLSIGFGLSQGMPSKAL
jgi:hypothetical protein